MTDIKSMRAVRRIAVILFSFLGGMVLSGQMTKVQIACFLIAVMIWMVWSDYYQERMYITIKKEIGGYEEIENAEQS